MIKEALEYIVGLRKPEVVEIHGEKYVDKNLERIAHNPKARTITMSTLTSLVEYIKANVDTMDDKMIIHVQDPKTVSLYSCLDIDRIREYLVTVDAQLPGFSYGNYMDHESFLIAMQSKFISGDDLEEILRFAGTVRSDSVAEYGDDGVSQKCTIKTGIATVGDAIVPNPVKLRPYRTFLEVEQPQSKFVFRMKQGGSGAVSCAIFEADGGAWKNAAMRNVQEYLQMELDDIPWITVIS